MKFNKGKCQFLSLGRNNLRHQDSLGTNQLESILAEKDLGVQVNTTLIMSEECVLTVKAATSFLGCIRQSIASRLRR